MSQDAYIDPEDFAAELAVLVEKYKASLADAQALPPMAEQHYKLALSTLETAQSHATLAHYLLMQRQ